MTGTNAQIVHKIMDGYTKQILDEVEKRCRKFCEDMVVEAVKARKNAPGAHDFTGNLITSIVVCLYRNGLPLDAWYASDNAQTAIRIKMSEKGKRYFFPVDYSGEKKSHYTVPDDSPEVSEGYGADDAKAFFRRYKPKGKNLFDIVVAYPVEYAEWVEAHRATTGIVQAYGWANRMSVSYLNLERVS